ncbi:MAG: glycosyltransferase family 39 protein [Chloroflexi bacterium]|nr:glycosyltransferase family 39 protein [Chloroflexota bacterium]
MHQKSRINQLRLTLIRVTIIGGVVFGLLFLLPFEYQKSWVDELAADGTVQSYTLGVYTSIKYCAGPLAVLFFGVIVFLIGFKRRANSLINSAVLSSAKFLSLRRGEIKELIKTILPSKEDAIPLMILSGIIILGAFFRYAYLWRPMGHDETYTFMAFASRGLRISITDYHLPNNQVFHTILVNLAYQMFGDSPAIIRFPAFLAGILIIPATYITGRIFYYSNVGLVGASIVASLPVLIDYSTTARGYTIITLFALLIICLAAHVKDHRNMLAWGLLVIFSSLGLYTNPTMIYPIGMAYTWLLLSKLIHDVSDTYGTKYYLYLLISSLAIIIIALILYLPIILYSGLQSLIGNDVIEALGWSDFIQSIEPRIRKTWLEWNRALPHLISLIAIIGLIASLFVPKLPKNKRMPLILAGILWIGTALLVQRVAPWPRIWLFLLPFFVIWISAGIIGLLELVFRRIPRGDSLMVGLIGIFITLPLITGLMRNYPQYDQKLHSQGEVEVVADFLMDYLQPKDVVVVTSPDTVVLKYYLRRNGLAKEFTELEKGKSFERAIVVVNQAQEQTLEVVLERRNFMDDVNITSVDEIYRSRRFILYQLPED